MKNDRELIISPSILSSDFYKLPSLLMDIESSGVKWLHFDVMDRHFVEKLTFGDKFVKDVRKQTSLFCDVHLMIEEPERDINAYLEAGADLITVHTEACKDINSAIYQVKQYNKRIGLSVKPNTPVDALKEYLSDIDLLLIMTVEPGKSGQKLISHTKDKISIVREWINSQENNILLQADGGINLKNIKELYELGIDVAVMGNAFFKNDQYPNFTELMSEIMRLYK